MPAPQQLMPLQTQRIAGAPPKCSPPDRVRAYRQGAQFGLRTMSGFKLACVPRPSISNTIAPAIATANGIGTPGRALKCKRAVFLHPGPRSGSERSMKKVSSELLFRLSAFGGKQTFRDPEMRDFRVPGRKMVEMLRLDGPLTANSCPWSPCSSCLPEPSKSRVRNEGLGSWTS